MLKSSTPLIILNLLLPIIFVILSKIIPAKKALSWNEYIKSEERFKRLDKLSSLLFVVLSILFLFLWFYIFWFFVSMHLPQDDNFLIIGFPIVSLFAPSLVMAMFSSVLLTEMIFKVRLKNEYNNYVSFSNTKAGMDVHKVIMYFSFILVPMSLGFVMLEMDYYLRFTPRAIFRNDFLSFSEIKYDYKDISGISRKECERDRNGKVIYGGSFYIITFKDGFKYKLIHKSIKTSDFEKKYLKRIMTLSNIEKVNTIDS